MIKYCENQNHLLPVCFFVSRDRAVVKSRDQFLRKMAQKMRNYDDLCLLGAKSMASNLSPPKAKNHILGLLMFFLWETKFFFIFSR